MNKLQTISAVLFAAMLVVTPVMVWAMMMYRELEATGLMIAALS